MSKHTPGPWRTEMNGFCRMAVVDKNYTYLTYRAGTDRMPDSELEANANLIAAAPDLLEALQTIKRRMYEPRKFALQEVDAIIDQAIARAKGESQ